jgi:dethiobiotin synthetase
MRGLFVTGTDTGVGKTILTAALTAAMLAEGERVRPHKPVVTGLEEAPGAWPYDHVLLAGVAGMTPEEVSPRRYAPPVSPHLAAHLAGEQVDPGQLLAAARAAAKPQQTLIVEGVGGLLVPLAESYTVRELAAELALPLLIAARAGLGTINHTLLTLQVARTAGLDVRAVVLTPWPPEASELERSNRATISRLGEVEVEVLSYVPDPSHAELARAGAKLPWRRWLGEASTA